jgi:FkbM family methyltransferase
MARRSIYRFKKLLVDLRSALPWIKSTSLPRNSLRGVLEHAKRQGFLPRAIVDVGAAYGSFALQCYNVFPGARYVLMEPLEEYRPFMESVKATIPTAEYRVVAATATKGDVVIHVHPDLVGSSLYLEEEDSNVNGRPRTVQGCPIDVVVKDMGVGGPFLMKVDAQGAELEILRGSAEVLRETEYVVLEVSLFKFFQNGPQINDVISFMKARGFVPYDLYGLQYRPLDDALSQVDIAFVKEHGIFRKHHFYATREQRQQQDRKMRVK